MPLHFEKHAAKGNEFVNRLAVRLGSEGDRDRAGRVLRCVFHALRNRLTIEESFQLLAQLPMVIKALYIEGWQPARVHTKVKTLQELSEEVIREDGNSAWRDFSGVSEAMEAIEAVVKTMADYVSAGELHDIVAVLPEDMKERFMVWSHTP
jgi:uncharacterized protein (DUF2267 family)